MRVETGSYLADLLVHPAHAVIRLDALLGKADRSCGPEHVLVVNRDEDNVLLEDVELARISGSR